MLHSVFVYIVVSVGKIFKKIIGKNFGLYVNKVVLLHSQTSQVRFVSRKEELDL